MSNREKLLVGAVVAVNVSVGVVLASRADFARLLHPHENAPTLALHPEPSELGARVDETLAMTQTEPARSED